MTGSAAVAAAAIHDVVGRVGHGAVVASHELAVARGAQALLALGAEVGTAARTREPTHAAVVSAGAFALTGWPGDPLRLGVAAVEGVDAPYVGDGQDGVGPAVGRDGVEVEGLPLSPGGRPPRPCPEVCEVRSGAGGACPGRPGPSKAARSGRRLAPRRRRCGVSDRSE